MNKAIEIMKCIGKILIKCIMFMLKLVYAAIESFILWVIEKYRNFQFNGIYIAFIIINFLVVFVSIKKDLIIFNIVKVILALIQIALILVILYKILSNKEKLKLELYLKYMADWSCAALYAIAFSSVFMMNIFYNVSKLLQYIFYVQLFLTMHYWYRRFINKYVKHWVMYTLYFLILPLISLFIWVLIGDTLSRICNMPILISDTVIGYMTIIFTVLIFNFEIYIAPKEIRSEVKVAVYLILALYSTISYCFFISDYLSEPIFNFLKPYSNEIANKGISLSKELIKGKVEWILKWFTLPYLIGAVFGCFTLELVDRNEKVKERKISENKNEDNQICG
ncbi:hypothetical protein [Calorimonas adulescens]|uniref:Uncharacterized protein n=1 Tax=Calorimonas adulescens TaxID=2606906 RepID=A0A5D8QDA4_9THEO|nr:hypothetical protein [Calorimonas adulescens]TZE82630.1 hypothetical protein FWJ32_04980 [Calorimonas adulescens]